MKKRTNLKTWLVIALLFQGIHCTTAVGDIIYVDVNTPDNNDGSSWAKAYKYLQDGLAIALWGDEIRVADGNYYPDANTADPCGTGNREATFQLINGVALYGGYAGYGEPEPNERDVNLYETILSGDLDGNDTPGLDPCDLPDDPNSGENSYHIVTGSGTDATAVLDGFTITAGNADGDSSPHLWGGGMLNEGGSPTVTNCTFSRNSALFLGGGMSNWGNSPTVTNCTFSDNSAGEGGGMYNNNSDPNITNCTFSGNSANIEGGGISNEFSSPTVTNCTFSDNSTSNDGGGMDNDYSSPRVTNCTFSGNSANFEGGGMCNNGSDPNVTNCTFSGNSAGGHGGGMFNEGGSPTVTNCTFTGNSVLLSGGGMLNFTESSPIVTNCTFSGNTAETGMGGGMSNWDNSEPTLTNCILWDNTALDGNEIALLNSSTIDVNYCDIRGGQADVNVGSGCTLNWGTGNIDADPMFVDANGPDNAAGTEDDNLRLLADSNCIDAGENTAVPADITDLDNDGNTIEPIPFDLDGNPRFVDGDYNDSNVVDMGAYEFQAPPLLTVLDPNGGETIMERTNFTILWSSVAGITDVNIEYSTNAGTEWTPIDTVANTGSYLWTVPEEDSHQCLIKISDACDPGVFDTSDAVFSIIPVPVIYVDANTPDNNDGSSWAKAYQYLQDALADANSDPNDDEIRVAEGTYYPDANTSEPNGTGNREATFGLINGVALYGGYAGYGAPDPNERNIELYETVLSGDIDSNDVGDMNDPSWSENSMHVVTGSYTDTTAVLDGFTVTAGYAFDDCGGGMLNYEGSPRVANCTFSRNLASDGGGMYNNDSSPTVTSCTFSENWAIGAGTIGGGGGMNNTDSNSTVTNCTFSGNKALWGGGMYNILSGPTVTNCTFSGNLARYGGGMENTISNTTVTNCTFSVNHAGFGGGMDNYDHSNPTLSNCILWGNTASFAGAQIFDTPTTSSTTVNYSDIQGGWSGTENKDQDPCFIELGYWDGYIYVDGDYHLLPDSPCIDAGDNTTVPVDVTTDLDGHGRIVDGDCNTTEIVDMGAYEFSWSYIGDFAGGCDVDLRDFSFMALTWLLADGQVAYDPNCDISIPADSLIDEKDLKIFTNNWLAGK